MCIHCPVVYAEQNYLLAILNNLSLMFGYAYGESALAHGNDP